MGKKSFVFYNNWAVLFSSLDNEDAGALIKAICCHSLGMKENKLNGTLDAIYQMIASTMDNDAEKYDTTCQKRREAIKTRWENRENQKNTNVYKSIQGNTDVFNDIQMHYDKDKDKDKDKDIHTVYESVQGEYNQLSNLPKCNAITKGRKEKIDTLLEIFSFEEIIGVFNKANNTSWLCGNNEKRWKADFDWLIDIDNFVKVQDGRYDNLAMPEKGDYKSYKHGNYNFEELERELRNRG